MRNEWRGDALAQSQVSVAIPENVEVGDYFYIKCNGKLIAEVYATQETATDVATGLVGAWNSSTAPEAAEISAEGTSSVTLTANTPGYPFIIEAGTVNSDGGAKLEVAVFQQGTEDRNEVQRISLDGAYSSGTFTLSNDFGSGAETTSALAYNASAAQVRTAIEGLASVAPGDVLVTGSGPWFVTWQGSFAASEVPEFSVNDVDLAGTNTVDVETIQNGFGGADTHYLLATVGLANQSGTFTLTFDGQTTGNIAFDATDAQVQSALEALANIAPGDVIVKGYVSFHPDVPGAVWVIRFSQSYAGVNKTLTVNNLNLTWNAKLEKVVSGGASLSPEVFIVDYGGMDRTPGGLQEESWKFTVEGSSTTFNPEGRAYFLSVGNATSTPVAYADYLNYVDEQNIGSDYYFSIDVQYVHQLFGLGASAITVAQTPIWARHFVSGSGWVGICNGTVANGNDYPLLQISSAGVNSEDLDHAAAVHHLTDGSSGSQNEIQQVVVNGSGGTWDLTVLGQTASGLAFGVAAATLETAVEGLSSVGAGNVSISGSGTFASPYVFTFENDLGSANVDEMTGDGTNLTGGSGRCIESTSHNVGVNTIQTIDVEATVVSGYFTISFGGVVDIAFDADAPTVQAALETLYGSGNVSVSGSAGDLTVEFIGARAKTSVPEMQYDDSNLTGGAGTQLLTISRTVDSLGPNHLNDPTNWSLERVPEYGDDVIFEMGNVDALYGGVWVAEVEFIPQTEAGLLHIPEHSFADGQKVQLFTSDTLPAELSTGTDYFVIAVNKDFVQLAATVDAEEGIYFGDAGTGTHSIEVRFNTVKIYNRWSGKGGLPNWNANTYVEYRPRYWRFGMMGDKDVIIGLGDGSGSSLLRIDLADTQANVKVITTGGSSEAGIPTLLLLNNNALTNIEVIDGDVGIAFEDGQTSTINRITQRGGSIRLGQVTLTEIDKTSGELLARRTNMSGVIDINA